ncbi:sensor histidine kinase [Salinimicrobium xinjiangense]|uniref:sensor histidine kinase n=1 Tax=Salinimicrobium xinjiangense TaxID=438596 RepID=UPI0004122A8A|nr:HAMP domain-containing sensor histidine kinase [Salinimicrobium xinjiangense]
MKLLNYTTTYFAVILVFLLAFWALIFYFEILDEIYDSMDDGLDNQKMLIIRKARQEPSILEKSAFEDGNYIITPTTPELSKDYTDAYRDTLMFMENESEYEPVRLLESVFQQDDSFYKIKVVTSMVEEDDLQKELFFSLLWLYLGLVLTIVLLNSFFQQKAWKPFYKLLRRLENFSIEKDDKIKFEKTNIEEFQLLNKRVDRLLKKSVESYKSQKEFIENASHELQTPLAISINKLELMAENADLPPKQMEELGAVLQSLEKLTRLNRSLLLLSRIENRQFAETEKIDWNALVKQIIAEFEDFVVHRDVKIILSEEESNEHSGNKDLAGILISNLLKNAILHSHSGSAVEVNISSGKIEFKNPGTKALVTSRIFSRFKGAEKADSTGLGLAISKAIADKMNLELSYTYTSQKHVFTIKFQSS